MARRWAFILRRSELASNEVSPVPLDYAVGDTQGIAIGYMFQKALHNELARRGINKPVIAPVTQTRVSPHDDAFASPSKPIGAFLDEATAQQRQQQLGWTLMEDAGRGWRRTVPLLHHWKLLSTTPSLTVRRDIWLLPAAAAVFRWCETATTERCRSRDR